MPASIWGDQQAITEASTTSRRTRTSTCRSRVYADEAGWLTTRFESRDVPLSATDSLPPEIDANLAGFVAFAVEHNDLVRANRHIGYFTQRGIVILRCDRDLGQYVSVRVYERHFVRIHFTSLNLLESGLDVSRNEKRLLRLKELVGNVVQLSRDNRDIMQCLSGH